MARAKVIRVYSIQGLLYFFLLILPVLTFHQCSINDNITIDIGLYIIQLT